MLRYDTGGRLLAVGLILLSIGTTSVSHTLEDFEMKFVDKSLLFRHSMVTSFSSIPRRPSLRQRTCALSWCMGSVVPMRVEKGSSIIPLAPASLLQALVQLANGTSDSNVFSFLYKDPPVCITLPSQGQRLFPP